MITKTIGLIYMSKGLIKNITILMIISILCSCSTSESIEYENQTFKDLYPRFDINNEKYSSYIYQDILLSSEVKEVNYGLFLVWLGFDTKLDSADVFIKKATITGNGLTKIIDVNEWVNISENLKRDSKVYDLRSASYRLIEIKSHELAKYVDDDKLTLNVTYKINGSIHKVIFKFQKKIVRRVIFPT